MTKDEVVKILAIMNVAYPTFQEKYTTKQQKLMLIELWETQFKDFSYNDVSNALNDFIATDTKGFPCTIGMIKDMIYKSKNADELSPEDAWNLVRQACKRGGYNAEEEFAKLPKLAQRIIGSSEQIHYWAITPSINWSVESSNFMKSYRERTQYEREYSLMPSVKRMPSLTYEEMVALDDED